MNLNKKAISLILVFSLSTSLLSSCSAVENVRNSSTWIKENVFKIEKSNYDKIVDFVKENYTDTSSETLIFEMPQNCSLKYNKKTKDLIIDAVFTQDETTYLSLVHLNKDENKDFVSVSFCKDSLNTEPLFSSMSVKKKDINLNFTTNENYYLDGQFSDEDGCVLKSLLFVGVLNAYTLCKQELNIDLQEEMGFSCLLDD